jgi:hypothetical protein
VEAFARQGITATVLDEDVELAEPVLLGKTA